MTEEKTESKIVYSWLDLLPSARKELPGVKLHGSTRLILLASLLMYLAACIAPAVVVSRNGAEETWPGLMLLCNGIFAVFSGQFGWFANFWYLMSLMATPFQNWKGVRIFGTIALILGLTSFLLIGKQFPANEGGVGEPYVVVRMDFGFYLWLASILVIAVQGWKRVSAKPEANADVR